MGKNGRRARPALKSTATSPAAGSSSVSSLFKQFSLLVNNNFAKEITESLYQIFDDPSEIGPYLKSYKPPEFEDKWYDTNNGFKMES